MPKELTKLTLYYPDNTAYPWGALKTPSGPMVVDPADTKAIGFVPVYNDKREAEKAHPGAAIQKIVKLL